MRPILVAIAAVGLSFAPAHADLLRYRFTVPINEGLFAGTIAAGSFALDDRYAKPGHQYYYNDKGLNAKAFEMRIGDRMFTRDNADAVQLVFDGGRLTRFAFTGAPSGYARLSIRPGEFDFVLTQRQLVYVSDGPTTFAASDKLVFTAVPEPAPLALGLLGLAGIAIGRRARRA